MATVTKPIALDESLNTTESPSRNVADVLAEELQNIAQAIGGSGGDSVSWTQIQSTGTKIAEIEINGTSTNVYAPNGGGGGGGHTIEGADGTALSQEPTLQFADADATDDAVNEKTVVNVVRKRTQAQYDAMSAADKAKGIIHITDADAKPLFDTQVRHGDTTVNALLNQIGYLSGLRFKNLGTSFTAEQQAAIANGDLTDFWNGDYWVDEAQGIVWRIVDNTGIARRRGDTEFDSPSLIIMPDNPLIPSDGVTHLMNDTNTTVGGYNGTKYRSTYRTQCKTKVTNFFGATHCASHREQLSSDVSGGKASNWSWQDCDVELPSEVNIYGHVAWSCYTDGGSAYNIGSEWGQFRLFSLAPYMAINRNVNSWLRDVVSSQRFSAIQGTGNANAFDAGNEWVSLKPFFVLV